MRFPVWITRILLFVLFLVPVLHDAVEVSLVLPFSVVWYSPLILIVLAFFAVGILLVMLATALHVMRYRSVASRLCRQIGHMKKVEVVTEASTLAVADSPYHAPGLKA